MLRDKFGKSVKKAKKDFEAQKFESRIGDSRQTNKLLNDIKGTTRKSSQVHDNSVQEDLQNINNWLIANKLILNMDKTVEMNIRNKNSASKSVFKFDDVLLEFVISLSISESM